MSSSSFNGGSSEADLPVGSIDEIFVGNGLDRYPCLPDDIVVPPGAIVLVRGWAADPSCTRPANELVASVDGRIVRSRYRLQRSDVAEVHGRKNLAQTGFHVTVETVGLDLGEHELRIVLDPSSPQDRRAFGPLRFRIDERASSPLRPSVGDTFTLVLDRIHAINEPASSNARFEQKQTAIVSGRLYERANGRPPVSATGIIDGFTSTSALVGLRADGKDDGFLLCFPNDRELGEHELAIVAVSESGAIERVIARRFDVVPMCCVPAEPIEDERIADAQIEWAPAMRSRGPFTRDEIGSVRGWAFDPVDGDSIGEAFVVFADGRAIALQTRQRRDDVPVDRRPPGARNCGLVGSMTFAAFAPGTYVGHVMVSSKDYHRLHRTNASIRFEVS